MTQQLTQECLLGTDVLSQYGCVVGLLRYVIIADLWKECTPGGQE